MKRLLLFIPGLFLISIVVFYLSAKSPLEELAFPCISEVQSSFEAYESCLKTRWELHGLNKPLFYFSFRTWAEPDTLHRIYDPLTKKSLEKLILKYGNWPEIEDYYLSINHLDFALVELREQLLPPTQKSTVSQFKGDLLKLPTISEPSKIQETIERLSLNIQNQESLGSLKEPFKQLQGAFLNIQQHATPWKNYLPAISWHGWDNRYHHWISQAIQGHWGYSYMNNQSINQQIKDRLGITLRFAIITLILVFAISIPLGIWAAQNRDTAIDKISGSILFAANSIPSFWMAILLLFAFANRHVLEIFPSTFNLTHPSFSTRLMSMVLPVIAYGYGSIAVMSRIIRNSLLEVEQIEFMRTARAKGLKPWQVTWRHALRNALMPIISLSVFILPGLFSGSVVIERIFSIPGLGSYIFEAVEQNNTPIILAIFSILGLLTLLGYLISDLLVYWADPRINKKR